MTSTDLSPDLLSQTITIYKGTLPVVLTVPHDGSLTSVGSVALDYLGGKLRDLAVSILATDVYESVFHINHENITLIMQRVKRQFITPAIQEYFEQQCIDHIKELANRNTQILHLDLHGFKRQPAIGKFDVILGTGHRTTIQHTNLDYQLGEFLRDSGYSVYVPSEEVVEGELYAAGNEHTLIQKVKTASINNVVSIQIEIAPQFRMPEYRQQGISLSQVFAEFVLKYVRS